MTWLVKLSAKEAFQDLNDKYSSGGAYLRGLRAREGLTQVAFAKIFGITQGDLSKMENGKLEIGKKRAKQISDKFGFNYQRLL